MKKKVTVLGSFVVDLMACTPHLPKSGETVKGSFFRMGPGGKGFNQGVAAHKAGACVSMITKLGKDSFADIALSTMKDLRMNTDHLLFSDVAQTGIALIMVDEKNGQNEIVIVSGSCDTITREEVLALRPLIADSSHMLLQFEINFSAFEHAVQLAYKAGCKIILNPAPALPVSKEILEKIDLITPNEVEAEILSGISVKNEAGVREAAGWFKKQGVKNVIITLGKKGAFVLAQDNTSRLISSYKVNAVDTTGAGDAFNGGLLAALSEGHNIWNAVKFANATAALSVQKIGTAPAMPTRNEIDNFLKTH